MSMVQETIRGEIMALMLQSKDLREHIDTAKTKPKKDLYHKKLKKINNEAADLLIALDKLEKEEDAKKAPQTLTYERV